MAQPGAGTKGGRHVSTWYHSFQVLLGDQEGGSEQVGRNGHLFSCMRSPGLAQSPASLERLLRVWFAQELVVAVGQGSGGVAALPPDP